ncbi:MAG: O-methyltransferase [Calditrichota bacterium]
MQNPSYELRDAVKYIEPLLPDIPDLPYAENALSGVPIQPTVGTHAAALLEVLICTRRPQRILEIGTSFGYAACVMGRVAAEYGGSVTTIEVREELASAARRNVAAKGLTDTVEVIQADADDVIEELAGPYGLILQDGHKMKYASLLDRLVSKLESNGILVTDDVLFPVMKLPESVASWQTAVDQYNRMLTIHPQLHTVWLPIGDGIAVSVKRAE